jgi:hypothetical protein
MRFFLVRRCCVSMWCMSWMVVFLEDPLLVFPPPFFGLILRKSPLAVQTDKFQSIVKVKVKP